MHAAGNLRQRARTTKGPPRRSASRAKRPHRVAGGKPPVVYAARSFLAANNPIPTMIARMSNFLTMADNVAAQGA